MSSAFGDPPATFQDVLDRLDELENRPIAVADLPVKALQDKLALDWQPDARDLHTPAELKLAMQIATGIVTTWNWSGLFYTDILVAHGMGTIPTGIIVPSAVRFGDVVADARAPWLVSTGSWSTTSFTMRVSTANRAAIGAFAANEPIPWIAYI